MFIYLSVDGPLSYFHVLVIVNNAAMNMCGQELLEHLFSILLVIYLGVELLGHTVIPRLTA